MTFDPVGDKCLVQTIHLARFAGRTVEGDPQFDPPRPIAAYVEPKRKVTFDSFGEEVVTNFLVLTDAAVVPQDRLWMIGEDPTDVTKARKPVSADTFYDEDGTVSHYELKV